MFGQHRKTTWSLKISGGLIATTALAGTFAMAAQAEVAPERIAAIMGASESAKSDTAAAGGAAKKVSAQDVIALAKKQVGTKEASGGRTQFQKWYTTTDRAQETLKRDGGKLSGYLGASWCDMFVSWVGTQLGHEKEIGQDAYTVAHAKWFKANGEWGTTPKPGAVVFFAWNGSKSLDAINHVGLVVGEGKGGKVKTVEGNTDNAVKERERSKSTIVGYGYPDYTKTGHKN